MNPFPKEPSGTTGKSPWFQPWDEAGLEPLKGERKKGTGPACSFVPDGTRFLDAPNPAMNRWAILKRPSGTGFAAELDQHRLKSAIRALRHRRVHQPSRRDESLHQSPHRPATILPAQRGLTYQGNRGIHDNSLDGNGHKEAQNARKDSDVVLLAPLFGQQMCALSRGRSKQSLAAPHKSHGNATSRSASAEEENLGSVSVFSVSSCSIRQGDYNFRAATACVAALTTTSGNNPR